MELLCRNSHTHSQSHSKRVDLNANFKNRFHCIPLYFVRMNHGNEMHFLYVLHLIVFFTSYFLPSKLGTIGVCRSALLCFSTYRSIEQTFVWHFNALWIGNGLALFTYIVLTATGAIYRHSSKFPGLNEHANRNIQSALR